MPGSPENNKYQINKVWRHRMHRIATECKLALPASVDDCVAYFTGYKKTSIKPLPDIASFLDLIKKLITYCILMNDKETLHLLFYSVRKRYLTLHFDFDLFHISGAWGAIALDLSGLYQGKPSLQIQDMSRVFLTFLSFIETKGKKDLSVINISPLIPWKVENSPNLIPPVGRYKKKPLLKETWHGNGEEIVYFTRGGGVYHMIDMLRKVSPGTHADNHRDVGIYVTPPWDDKKKQGDRDFFYATEAPRARIYGDIPSLQSGKIAAKFLYVENNNSYETFIRTEDLVNSVKDLRIIPLSFLDDLASFNSSDSLKLILEYGPKDGVDEFKDRIMMINAVAEQRKKEEREELKKRYQPQFNFFQQSAPRLGETHALETESSPAKI